MIRWLLLFVALTSALIALPTAVRVPMWYLFVGLPRLMNVGESGHWLAALP